MRLGAVVKEESGGASSALSSHPKPTISIKVSAKPISLKVPEKVAQTPAAAPTTQLSSSLPKPWELPLYFLDGDAAAAAASDATPLNPNAAPAPTASSAPTSAPSSLVNSSKLDNEHAEAPNSRVESSSSPAQDLHPQHITIALSPTSAGDASQTSLVSPSKSSRNPAGTALLRAERRLILKHDPDCRAFNDVENSMQCKHCDLWVTLDPNLNPTNTWYGKSGHATLCLKRQVYRTSLAAVRTDDKREAKFNPPSRIRRIRGHKLQCHGDGRCGKWIGMEHWDDHLPRCSGYGQGKQRQNNRKLSTSTTASSPAQASATVLRASISATPQKRNRPTVFFGGNTSSDAADDDEDSDFDIERELGTLSDDVRL
ncbi:hypothetical protein BKA62DRAFT_34779 [Auriculariales sp. MPI-PUGE-AT-0066]|nr:hypothetical protein BKA62DRAFT_34779 [Auriculariales sp. MPI-PUGE-AT-0066]